MQSRRFYCESFSGALFFGTAAIVCAAFGSAGSEPLSEEGAVAIALQKNTSVKVYWLERKSDSLGLVSEKAAWLPLANLSAATTYGPFDHPLIVSGAAANATQAVAGGGTARAGINYSNRYDVEPDSGLNATTYSVSFTQPILRNGWQNGSVACQIKLAELGSVKTALSAKRGLAADLSSIRSLYWQCSALKEQSRIAANALAYATAQLDRERTRFVIGDATPLDTLSAFLEELRARQSLLTAENSGRKSINELARALNIASSEIAFPESLSVTIGTMPDEQSLANQIEVYDPDLRGSDLDRQILDIRLRLARNNLLPSLDLKAAYAYNTNNGSNGDIDHNSMVSLSFSYDVPTRTGRIAREQAALELEKQRMTAAGYQRALRESVADLMADWNLAIEQLTIAASAAEVARRKLEASAKKRELGSLSQLEYIKAQNDYVSEAFNYIGQQIQLKQLEIGIEKASGAVFARFGVKVE